MTETAVEPGRGTPEVRKLPMIRRAMVRHMVDAATIPCFYLRVSADVERLVAYRNGLRAAAEGRVPSLNDFIIRAVGLALREHPDLNASWADGTVEILPRVNVGMAVAVKNGLVVPAIYDADRRSPDEIAEASRQVAELAANRKLSRELLEDATFTVSNLGMFGIEDFDPVLNPPQAGILGVGSGIGGKMRLTLGCDHRVVTGAEAAPFLGQVKDHLEDPESLVPNREAPAGAGS